MYLLCSAHPCPGWQAAVSMHASLTVLPLLRRAQTQTEWRSMDAVLTALPLLRRARKQAQLASSEAAAKSARADAAARATRPKSKSSTRNREDSRLAAENRALLAIIEELANKDTSLQHRIDEVRSSLRAVRCQLDTKQLVIRAAY